MNNSIRSHLLEALELAKISRGFCSPNPSVGALITDQYGKVLSSGYHKGAGHPHAEVDALAKLDYIPENASLYVTLEPCNHFGRTPPCTDAIIKSGIKQIFFAYCDPNPIVSGKGAEKLTSAGLSCTHFPILEIDNFYESYQYWHATNQPFVTAKIAMTLDGKIARRDFEPISITGNIINNFTHKQRKEHDAILTTVKTIIADNPQLNARYDQQVISKPLYILDKRLDLPLSSKIFFTTKSITVFHSKNISEIKHKNLSDRGVRLIEIAEDDSLLNLNKVLDLIGQDGIHDLWVEAGGKCFSTFVKKQLLQRAFIYVSPRWLGDGRSAFQNDSSIDFSKQKIRWEQIGQDVLCEINFNRSG